MLLLVLCITFATTFDLVQKILTSSDGAHQRCTLLCVLDSNDLDDIGFGWSQACGQEQGGITNVP